MPASFKYQYHILVIVTIAIWGVTFVSTKILIEQGLCYSLKDELLCIGAGLGGGSLYFLILTDLHRNEASSQLPLLITNNAMRWRKKSDEVRKRRCRRTGV